MVHEDDVEANAYEKARQANLILYQHAVLCTLRFEDTENLWIWNIRIKALEYCIRRYDLLHLLDPKIYAPEELAEIRSTSELFKVPSFGSASGESAEARELKEKIRRLFRSTTSLSQHQGD